MLQTAVVRTAHARRFADYRVGTALLMIGVVLLVEGNTPPVEAVAFESST
jgi:hypothetical protein